MLTFLKKNIFEGVFGQKMIKKTTTKKQLLTKNFPKNILFKKSQYNSLQLFFENTQIGFDDFFTKLLLI